MIKSSNINIMTNTLLKVARVLRRDFNELEKLQNSKLGTNSFVQNCIKNITELISSELKKARPTWKIHFLNQDNDFIEKVDHNEEYEFLVKPISGIANFSKSVSYFASSISLIHNNEAEAAIVYDPIKDDLFFSEKGKGAFLNNSRMRTSANRNLNKAIVIFESKEVLYNKYIQNLFNENLPEFRIFGSSSLDLAGLSSGKFDCYVCKSYTVNTEPALLIMKESGGIVVIKSECKEISFLSNPLFSEII